MRRRPSILTLSVVTLSLLASPAAAADRTEAASAGLIGSFEGLALSAVVGIVVGFAVFHLAQGGPTDEPDDHHH